MRYWNQSDFPGADLKPHLTEDTVEDCMDRCLEKPECNAFTFDSYKRFDPDRGWCWLKTNAGNYNMNYDGMISGMKCSYRPDVEPPRPPDNKYPLYDGKLTLRT